MLTDLFLCAITVLVQIIQLYSYGGEIMLSIDKLSRVPIYEQIEGQVKELILSGALSPGDKLPSVRTLSLELNINPNTIQKAYLELDRQQVIASAAGRGSFVTENAREILLRGENGKLADLQTLISELLMAGISEDSLRRKLDRAIENARNNK